MNDKITVKDKFQYWMDNQFSKGTGALILWLGVLSVVVIVLAGVLISALKITPEGEQPMGFFEAAWASLMRTLDAGSMVGDTGWGFRFVMFLVTLGGVFIISALIGVLTTGVDNKIEALRKGRSRVLESGHTVILGWNQQVFTLISELVTANANQKKSCIVVMGPPDKVEMEEEIRQKVEDTGKTRIVCRSGEPMDMADLNIVGLNTAKAIVVLSPGGDEPDAEVIKIVLAIVNHPKRRAEPYHIVAEIYDPKNMESALVAGGDEVEWVLVGDFVARVIAQTCRQSGLSVVYTELMDFGGDEIYFTQQPSLVGRRFGETLAAFETNTVMGIVTPDGNGILNPPMDTVIREQDRLIVIAEDDDKIFLTMGKPQNIQEAAIVSQRLSAPQPEKTLILGWNKRGAAIIRELDHYVAPGSSVLIVADAEDIEEDLQTCCPILEAQQIVWQRKDSTSRRVLDSLPLAEYHHIIVLCYSDTLSAQQADARTIVTLLHLRDIAEKTGLRFSIVSEMLDLRNRNLADVTRADDFIVSDKLVSLMLAQVSENKYLNSVFKDMFDPEGSEIYLKPIEDYVQVGKPLNFYTVVEAARRYGEVAIGYRQVQFAKDANRSYGVKINPNKSEEIVFAPGDRLVVIADE
jgi:voltage-gated potassium channel Kch